MIFQYQFDNDLLTVRVEKAGAGYAVTINGRVFNVSAVPRPGELALTVEGERHTAYVAADGPRRWVALGGAQADSHTFVLTVPQTQKKSRRGQTGGHEALEAQMPGLVRKVLVADGQAIEQGQVLLVLEAMKMEIRVSAPHAGQVEKVLVHEGETVGRGQVLIELLDKPGTAPLA
jgi:propionyl-CoA carboxylase alpha chain